MEFDESNFDFENSNLPNQLDEFTFPVFDQRSQPFSPTSPGVRSPCRPRTMKEYEEDLATLKGENFNLKVRIYFLEQHRTDPTLPKDVDELRHLYTGLKVQHDIQKKDLETKESLLLDAYKALDVQKKELEAMEQEKLQELQEKQELRCRVENLEKELKDYHQRFMETSVPHLDDTNALYAMTFGLHANAGPSAGEPLAEEKELYCGISMNMRELQEELARYKERVRLLEGEIAVLNDKNVDDEKNLQKVKSQLQEVEERLEKILGERDRYEKLYSKASIFTAKLEKSVNNTLKEKDAETAKFRSLAEELRKQLTEVENQLQETQERSSRSQTEKKIKILYSENEKLKHEVKTTLKRFQQQTEERSPRNQDQEPRPSDLQREIQSLKSNNRQSQKFIQTMYSENKRLTAQVEELKETVRILRANTAESSKEEVTRLAEKEMSADKSILISHLQAQVEELIQKIKEKDCTLQELREKLDALPIATSDIPKQDVILQFPEDGANQKENISLKEIKEKDKEIENLKKDLKKKTFNLQGLVNKELWDKNREIEKLNKLCERQHVEMLSLEKQLRESQLSLMQDKVNSFASPVNLSRGIFDDKENLQPMMDSCIQNLIEDKRQLQRKVEELQSRLLNTPERDKESEQVQALREEKEAAEKQRKEAVNACVLLTTRLQELADFLESLLPLLCSKKRKYVQQAVDRSRELSRSLTLAAEESSLLQCSMWTDLQPSLVVPLLPDISTVDFWSGDEAEEAFSAEEETSKAQQDSQLREKSRENNPFLTSIFDFDGKSFSIGNKTDENPFYENIADITEGSLVETCNENALDKTCTRVNFEVKSPNIGTITLTSKKKYVAGEGETNKHREDGNSECETWSEPDRDVSYARMGLKEDPSALNKSTQFSHDDTSETAESIPKSQLSRRGSEIQRLQRKIRNLEQVNAALRSELVILHQLTPPALSRQDKATSIDLSRQSSFYVPAHLLEEIRNQREKLEASLFHNDYIRRQLESTVSSLQRNQGEGDKMLIAKLKEVTNQLEASENEATELKREKANLNTKVEFLHTSLQQTSDELKEKQENLDKMESETARQLNEIKEKYSSKLSQSEQRCAELEKKAADLEKHNVELSRSIAELNDQIGNLTKEIDNHVFEGKKCKQLNDELNTKLQKINRQKDELQRLAADQEQLLADAERERQELATQLIARDREVSELSKRLSNVELTSGELEGALRSQLELATQQCAQFEGKIRDLDCCNKQMAQVERMKGELERRVAELEAANSELEARLASLNIVRHPMSDYDTDAGSSVVGSPRRKLPPPLSLPSPPSRPPPLTSPTRSHDLTSDYLSDQEGALSSPQSHVHGLWYPAPSQSQMSASPDLGIESDQGRFSSLETQPKSTIVSLRGTPVKELMKLEEENTQLRLNLQKTRHALEETLAQLTAANQHKRQYEAQLSAANQHKAKVERAICRQLHKTHSILKKARVNLEEDGKGDHC